MIGSKLATVAKGSFSRRQLVRQYLPVLAVVVAVPLVAAGMTYPGEFSFLTNTISSLGDSRENPPPGCWFFSGVAVVTGLAAIPLVLYIHRRMKPIRPIASRIGAILGVFAGACWAASGTIPIDEEVQVTRTMNLSQLHTAVATYGFYAMALASLTYLWAAVADSLKRFGGRRRIALGPVVWVGVVLYCAVIGLLAVDAIRKARGERWPGEGILSWTLWEWIVFFAMLLWMPTVALAMPAVPPAAERRATGAKDEQPRRPAIPRA